jgi:dUTPase
MSDFKIQVLPEGTLPTLAHKGDAGFDLSSTKEISLTPMERTLVPTGIK